MTSTNKVSLASIAVFMGSLLYFGDERKLDAFLTAMVVNLVIWLYFVAGRQDEDWAENKRVNQELREQIALLENELRILKIEGKALRSQLQESE